MICVITTLSRDVNGIIVHTQSFQLPEQHMTASGYLLTIKNLRI